MSALTKPQAALLKQIAGLPYGLPRWECNLNTARALERRGFIRINNDERWGARFALYIVITAAGRAALDAGTGEGG